MLNSRAVHQSQPRIKRGLCLALVGALELISAADWNILISILNLGFGDSGVSTSCEVLENWIAIEVTRPPLSELDCNLNCRRDPGNPPSLLYEDG